LESETSDGGGGFRVNSERDNINYASVAPSDEKTAENFSQGNDHKQSMTQEEKRRKLIKWGIIGGIVLIVVILAIVLPLTLIKPTPPTPPTPPGPLPLPGG
jgi:hypothetical protein